VSTVPVTSADLSSLGAEKMPERYFSRVVVGVDDSPEGVAALRVAVGMAKSTGAELVAVRAWALGLPRHGGRRLRRLVHRRLVLYFYGGEQELAARALAEQALAAATGGLFGDLAVRIETPRGDPAVALTAIADGIGDILVVGRGAGWHLRRILHGSVTRYCTRHAHCPLVAVGAHSTEGSHD
jgi:nucleotide-binding universal stress UspA family protein